MPTLKAIIDVLETIAPGHLAEEWDNVGLQAGQLDWPVKQIWIALDPLLPVVTEACRKNVDLLITHHPLIFPTLKAIDFNTPVGAVIQMAVESRLAIFSAHTNLDKAVGGINDVLVQRMGLKNVQCLGEAFQTDQYKLVLFAPVEFERQVLAAVLETPSLKTGEYIRHCFRHLGKGTLKSSERAKAFGGYPDGLSHFEEVRLEIRAARSDVSEIIDQIRAGLPDLQMSCEVFPLAPGEEIQGIGRVGELVDSLPLHRFVEKVKHDLGLPSVKVAGPRDLPVKRVALCSGSGGSLINRFFSSKADVFVSGDLGYHDAREVESRNLGLVDIGHFASEYIMVEELAARLEKIFSGRHMDVAVEACKLEEDPFHTA